MSTFLLILYITEYVLRIVAFIVLLFTSIYGLRCNINNTKKVVSLEESIEAMAKFQKISENRIRNIEVKVKDFKNEVSSDCPSIKEL